MQVVERAYDAPLDQARWQRVLDELVNTFGARASALLLRETSGPVYNVNEVSERYRTLMEQTGDYYLDELAKYEAPDWKCMSQLGPGQLLFDDKMGVPVDELEARPDYVFLRQHIGMNRRIGFRLNRNPGFFDAITIGFPVDLPAVPPYAVELLGQIIPHLAKAMELTRAFGLLRQKYQAVLSAIDHLKIGLAISLPTGEILIENEEARRQFETRDALWLTHGRKVSASKGDYDAAIRAAIIAASDTASGKNSIPEAVFQLEKRSGGSPVMLDISPLSDTEGLLNAALAGAILTFIDPDALPEFDIPRFGQLYGLSQAESEVCALLMQGGTAATVAEERSTSFNTARNQVKSVMQKTGAKNRGQLARQIARTIPPIR